MIQIITKDSYIYKNKITNKNIILSNFNEYKSFDLYDINVIDLSSKNLWYSASSNGEYLNDKSDLATIKNAINTCSAKVLILFPQNCNFYYDYWRSNKKYDKSVQLKTMKDKVGEFITKYIYGTLPLFYYEKGVTKVDDEIFESDFYFDEKKGIICCDKSKKVNTMALSDKIIISSLNLFSATTNDEIEKRLFVILNKIGFLEKNEDSPKWIEDIDFYDDHIYRDEIDKYNNEIDKLQIKIDKNNEKLKRNLEYKSILYSTGNVLAEQINKMLIMIFSLENKFNDIYEEDFNFKMDGVTFIVETKGLNNEVAGKNVSDAYDHLVIYEDMLEKNGIKEETKCLFFVSSERLKMPNERAKIKERQITIAKRNKTLIIDTPIFYKMFEDFSQQKIKSEDISKIFREQVGIIEYK